MSKPRLNQWISGGTAAALMLGLVPGAGAAGRFTKKEDTVIATQTAMSKPAQKAEREKKKPDLTVSDVFGGMGEDLKAITDSQIKVLKRLIDVTSDDDPEKPDLLFRMAELYAEQQRYYNFRAREMDEKVFDAQQKNDVAKANQMKATQKDYEKREQQWLLAAVKQYIDVADGPKYQTYKRMDQVLFYLAYLLTQVKKEEKARVYFKRLIKDYPQSPFLPHAYLSFGEYFFENRDLENALRFYEKVLQYPQSPVYGFALYKKGWVYYNLTQFKEALQTFVEVVEFATNPKRSASGKPAKGDAQLAKEAKKDIVRSYAQIGTPEKAWPFFQKYGKDYAPTMLEQLAELYNAQGKFVDSTKTYRELIKLNPGTLKLCNWQTEILNNTLSLTGSRAVPETVKELQRLSAVYEKTTNMQGIKKETLDECRDNTAGKLRELATIWHKEAQKTGVADTYANASDLYKEYIRRFPKEKDSYIMHWYYSELLFTLGQKDQNPASHWFCDAAPMYTEVVKMDPKGPKLKEAAYAAVIAWKNCLDVADEGQDEKKQVQEARAQKGKEAKAAKDQKKSDEEVAAPKPIPEKQQKMLEAFDTYIKYVPESAELVTIKYRRARVFYEYNHFQEAMPLFQEIAEKHSKSELAIYSANLLLDCMNLLKDYTNLEQQVERFLATPDLLKDEEFKKLLEKLKLGTMRLKVEQTEKQGDYRQAGVLYMQLADRYPNDPKINEIYFNAGVNFAKAHLVGLSIQAYNKLIEVRPQSEQAKKAIYFVGQSYHSIAQYENAADKYESFATQYPGEIADKETDASKKVDASLALYTAVTFRRGLGQIDQATKDVDQYLKNYGGRKEFFDRAAQVFFEQAQIYESKKDYPKLRAHFVEYLKNWSTKGGIDRQIIAEVKLGEIAWRESCPVKGENGACIEVKRERASTASQAQAKAAKSSKKLKNKKGPVKMQCGPETKSKITVYERKPALVKEAMAHFQKALQLFKGGAAASQVPAEGHDGRVAAMTRFAAQAKMAEGDQQYEQLLNMKVPTGLTFDPKQKKKNDEAIKKFKAWIEGKTKKLQETQKTYQAVILMKDAHWVIAAAARIGQLFQDFANGLYTTEVPQPPAPPPGVERDEWNDMFRNAYCDNMTDNAEPLDKKAEEGLSTCLNKSTELNWFNEWSRLCEAELNQIKPAEYPLASEIRAEPGYQTVPPDVASLVTATPEK